jgi:predicted hydrocarbon binding protein
VPRDESVTVKGSPIRSLLAFVATDLDAEQSEQAFRSLPAEFAERLRRPVLATECIPVHMLNRLTEEAARAKGEALETFAARAGRAAAQDAVRGIYRFFAPVLTPSALLGKASQMWKALYNQGNMVVERQTPGSVHLRVADFPSELAGCSRLTGWIEGMAELTGAKDLQIAHTRCYVRGDPECEWDVTWH